MPPNSKKILLKKGRKYIQEGELDQTPQKLKKKEEKKKR